MKPNEEKLIIPRNSVISFLLDREDKYTECMEEAYKVFEESDHLAKKMDYCFACFFIRDKAPLAQDLLRLNLQGKPICVPRELVAVFRTTLPAPKWGISVFLYNNKTKEKRFIWALPKCLVDNDIDKTIQYYIDKKQFPLAESLTHLKTGHLQKMTEDFNNSEELLEQLKKLVDLGLINLGQPKTTGDYHGVRTFMA